MHSEENRSGLTLFKITAKAKRGKIDSRFHTGMDLPPIRMDSLESSINSITEMSRMDSGSSLYMPSMYYDSDDEDGDTYNLLVCETRDDHIKKVREEDQQRRGSRYALLRSLAWSQDEEADTTSDATTRMESQPTTNDDPALLCTLIEGLSCTMPPPISVSEKNKYGNGRSSILWEQQVPSDRDLGAIVSKRETR